LDEQRRGSGHFFLHLPVVDDRLAVNITSNEVAQRAELDHGLCVDNRGANFQPVANNSAVLKQLRDFGVTVPGDFGNIPTVEGRAVVFAFVEYSRIL
jgi:hypothetical protein